MHASFIKHCLLSLSLLKFSDSTQIGRFKSSQICGTLLSFDEEGNKIAINPQHTIPNVSNNPITVNFGRRYLPENFVFECEDPDHLKKAFQAASSEITRSVGIKFHESPVFDPDLLISLCVIDSLEKGHSPTNDKQQATLSSEHYSRGIKMPGSLFIRRCFVDVKLQDLQETAVLIHELLHNIGINHPINMLNGEVVSSKISIMSDITSVFHNKLTPFDQKILQHCFNGIIKQTNDTLDIEVDDSKIHDGKWIDFLNTYNKNNIQFGHLFAILGIIVGTVKHVIHQLHEEKSLKIDYTEDISHLVLSLSLPNMLNSIYMVEKIADECFSKDRDCKNRLQRVSAMAIIICGHTLISNGLIDQNVIPISLLNIFFDDRSLADGKFRVRLIDEVYQHICRDKTKSDTIPTHSSQVKFSNQSSQTHSQDEPLITAHVPPPSPSSSSTPETEIYGNPQLTEQRPLKYSSISFALELAHTTSPSSSPTRTTATSSAQSSPQKNDSLPSKNNEQLSDAEVHI